jgi:hypothetical protein
MSEELFSEAEAAKIVQRAVHLQEENQASTYTPGVTREELVRIAAEVGVSVDFLDQAIRERGGDPTKRGFSLSREFERVVDGEMDPNNFDVLTPIIGGHGPHGGITQVGRSLRSNKTVGLCVSNFDVTSRNGRTRVTAKASPVLAMIFGGELALFSTGAAAAMITSGQPWLAGVMVALAGISASAWMMIGGTKAGHRKTEDLVNKVAQRVHEENQFAKNNSVNKNLAQAPQQADETQPQSQELNQS